MISDGRPSNPRYFDWPVTFTDRSETALMLQSRAIMMTLDLHDAYHLGVLMGCPVVPEGCTPETCLGMCDKSLIGFSLWGHPFRFEVAQFGVKLGGCPLYVLLRLVTRKLCHMGLDDVADWVDDLCMVVRVTPHLPCAGAHCDPIHSCAQPCHVFLACTILV